VARRFIGSVLVAACGACTPVLDPPWLLTRERELALRVEVVAQGGYGLPLDPGEPTVNEVLALDTVRATPRIVGADGPVLLGDFSPQWYLCDIGSCLLGYDDLDLPPCELEVLAPESACALPGGDTVEFQLGDFATSDNPDELFGINRAPTLGFIASTPSGPGTEACLDNIVDRDPLSGCLWMERPLNLGSFGEFVAGLEALGLSVDLSDSLLPLLDVPRNHNPSVETFTVTIDGEMAKSVHAGDTVRVPTGATVTVAYAPSDSDMDAYEVELDGDVLQAQDVFGGRWYASREVSEFERVPFSTAVTWRATQADPVTLHLVLSDDRGAEAWGWLDFDLD